jgi:hypothetical protein
LGCGWRLFPIGPDRIKVPFFRFPRFSREATHVSLECAWTSRAPMGEGIVPNFP